MKMPPILCVSGPSGLGKTYLLERVVRLLVQRGLRVGVLKHCGHIDAPRESKDSARLEAAGGRPTVAWSPHQAEVLGLESESRVTGLVRAFCPDCDLVLVEGGATTAFDRLRVDALPPGLASNDGRPRPDATADWIVAWLEERRRSREGVAGAVLVGGAGRRMGSDKRRLRVGGERVLARLCDLLADRTGVALTVGGHGPAEGLPLCAQWLPDDEPGLGPLGGIATALRWVDAAGHDEAVLTLGCDMPLVSGPLLDILLGERRRECAASALSRPGAERPEPLAAVYETHALPSLFRALAGGARSARAWLADVGAHRVTAPDALAEQLVNVNTPEDLARLDGEGGPLES